MKGGADKNQSGILNFYFFLFLLSVLVVRTFVYLRYSIRYVDSDQTYMWMGASDFANGIFMEPRYYGQSYNTFMEALFSVPLLWLDVPVYYAVPAATHFISVFPFVFISFYLFREGKKLFALLTLSILLCMPLPYDLLNALPRGFVTGLFFCSFFIVSIMHPRRYRYVTFNALLAVTAYFVNPNSVVVSLPFLVYVFFHNYRERRFYWLGLGCVLFWGINYLCLDAFYDRHPDYIQNPLVPRYSPEFFFSNISNLDQRFCHITFFQEGKSWSLLLAITIFLFLLFRRNRPAFFAFLSMPLIVLFSFCFGKISEGTDWVYISYSRMFLGIPLLLAVFVPLTEKGANEAQNGQDIINRLLPLALALPLIFSVYKLISHEATMARHFLYNNFLDVRVFPLSSVLDVMRVYKKACTDNNAELMLVSNGFIYNNFLAYAGPAADPQYPQTLETKHDKRYWVRDKFRDSVVTKFILISTRWDLDSRIPKTKRFSIKNLDGYGIVLIENNTMQMKEFLEIVNAYERDN